MDPDDEASPLCFNCAHRLGKYTWPDIPELVLGYCPQCGGTKPLDPPYAKGKITPLRPEADLVKAKLVA